MYWIGTGKQIEDHVLHCQMSDCQIHSRSQQKELAIHVEVPSWPWQKLGMDLFSMVVICMSLLLIITQSTNG